MPLSQRSEVFRPTAKWTLLILFALVIVWAPFPLGSNRGWSVGLLAMMLAGLMPLALWAFWGELSRHLKLIKWPAIAFGIVLAYIQVQAIFRIGDLDALIEAELGLMAGGLVFLYAFLLGASGHKFARALLYASIAAGALYALYALVELALPREQLLWFDVRASERIANATFVNRNSFATYAGLATLAAFAVLIQIPRLRTLIDLGIEASGNDGSSRQLNTLLFVFIALLLSATALLLTQSRGGILATGIGLVALTALAIKWRDFNWRGALVPLAGLAVLLGVLVPLAGRGVLARLAETGLMESGRIHLQAATLRMIADRPVTGQGFGAWETVFPAFRPGALRPFPDFDKAHNTYLETLAGLGLPMGLLLLAVFGWMVWRCIRGTQERRKGRLFPRLGLAAAVLVGLHALVDFSVQIPGVAVSFALLMGLGVAQSFPRRSRRA